MAASPSTTSNNYTPNGRKRWYDGHPAISRGVGLLEALPFDVQSIVAEGVNTVAEKDCSAHEISSSLKSLGKDKVLSMYKAKAKRRAYDQNPEFHKAMGYMYVLENNQRDFVGNKMLGITAGVQSYVQTCQKHELPVNLRVVQQITLVCIEEGQEGVSRLLDKINDDVKQAAKQHAGMLRASDPEKSEDGDHRH